MKRTALLLPALFALALAGCQSDSEKQSKIGDMFDMNKGMPWHDEDEAQVRVPHRIVGAWVDTVRHTQGGSPERGFGGRIHFYADQSDLPVQVAGELVIYAFDESGREPTDNRPTKRYVFPAGQLTKHMSESDLGPSYSFWLPWDAVGGNQTEVSLICRFQPDAGSLIVSEQTKHLLPGVMVAEQKQRQNDQQRVPRRTVIQTSAQQDLNAGGRRPADGKTIKKRMSTTSIALPQSIRQR